MRGSQAAIACVHIIGDMYFVRREMIDDRLQAITISADVFSKMVRTYKGKLIKRNIFPEYFRSSNRRPPPW